LVTYTYTVVRLYKVDLHLTILSKIDPETPTSASPKCPNNPTTSASTCKQMHSLKGTLTNTLKLMTKANDAVVYTAGLDRLELLCWIRRARSSPMPPVSTLVGFMTPAIDTIHNETNLTPSFPARSISRKHQDLPFRDRSQDLRTVHPKHLVLPRPLL
jgi:hypothetical protein